MTMLHPFDKPRPPMRYETDLFARPDAPHAAVFVTHEPPADAHDYRWPADAVPRLLVAAGVVALFVFVAALVWHGYSSGGLRHG